MSAADRTTEPRRFTIRLPRPLWFGVATVVLIVVPVSVRIGVPIYHQQVAIREIDRLGGIVVTERTAPKWLRNRMPDSWMRLLEKVVEVNLFATGATDATLTHLKGLTSVRMLCLDRTEVTDAGLVHLKGISSLESIELNRTRVSDAGLAHLKGLSRLKLLYLDRTSVTGEGADELQRAMPGLTVVL